MYDENNRYDKNPDYNLLDESGCCPVCGEEDLDYFAFLIEDNGGYFPCSCPHCAWEGKEWYTMNFVEYIDNK